MNQTLRANGKCTVSYQLEVEVADAIRKLSLEISAKEGRRVSMGEIIKRAVASFQSAVR